MLSNSTISSPCGKVQPALRQLFRRTRFDTHSRPKVEQLSDSGLGGQCQSTICQAALRDFAILAVLLAIPFGRADAQIWGRDGVRIHRIASPFVADGWHLLNDFGQLAGSAYDAESRSYRTAIFSPANGISYVLGYSEATIVPNALNDEGQIAGMTQSTTQAVAVSQGGAPVVLPSASSLSSALDNNNAGVTVGYETTENGDYRAVLWRHGSAFHLGGSAVSSVAFAVNEFSLAAGYSYDGATTEATIFDMASSQRLGTLGGQYSQATDINDRGMVTGWSFTAGNEGVHGFVYRDGSMNALPALGGGWSFAFSLDGSGRAVGYSTTSLGSSFGAEIWEQALGGFSAYRLQDIVNATRGNSGWEFDIARSVSENGRYISAWGINRTLGYNNWVVLEDTSATVTPEPGTLLLLASGLGGIVAARGRRRRMNRET
jgi:probable HAF family extracellular repeat protein